MSWGTGLETDDRAGCGGSSPVEDEQVVAKPSPGKLAEIFDIFDMMKPIEMFKKKFDAHNDGNNVRIYYTKIQGHLIIVWLKGSLNEYIQLRSGIANVSSLASPNLPIMNQ